MGKLGVITGASRGIGRACALGFAERGVDLALLGRPSEGLEHTRARCAAQGITARSYACDMTDAEAIARAASDLVADHGPPQLVVNNAGILQHGPKVHEIAVEDWDHVMAVNLRGPFVLCRALLPAMLTAGKGRFIHVSSISGTVDCPQMAHYGASKWGLIGFSKALAAELRGTGLQSLAVLPGSVRTAMLDLTPFEPAMTPEEVASVIIYHGLDAPNPVNGAAIEVYG
ncbi:MAG: SDR family oxidoreductase [Deltaproteobacteria bacterium]|nr:SDR family oxidoreductase [Deltaproteobacteria bacterium]